MASLLRRACIGAPSSTRLLRLVHSSAGSLQGQDDSAVFTGTADVQTHKPEGDVATDSNRHWVSADDLGTRANAALDKAAAATTDSPPQQQPEAAAKAGRGSEHEQQPEAGAEAVLSDAAGADDACHPADPYCNAGEAAPRPDDFHEQGDETTPPSSGFPA